MDIPVVAFYHSNFPRVFAPWPERATGLRRATYDLAWRYARAIDRHFAHTIVASEFVANDLRRAGIDRDELSPAALAAVTAAHPRPNFKQRILTAFNDGMKHRPQSTFGTVNDDVLAHFDPTFTRENFVDIILNNTWPE